MKKSLWILPLLVFGAGCGSKPVAPEAKPGMTANAPPGAAGQPTSSGGDIAPTTMAPLPNAPITGGTDLGGGGGGVQQAVKDKAKDVAAGQGQGSLGNAPDQNDQQDDGGQDDQGN